MSLRRRLFITLSLIVLVGFLSIARWIRGELRNSYAQVVEEILVDYAHFISARIENDRMSKKGFESLNETFTNYKNHNFNAKIFDFIKSSRTIGMYVTDEKGIVLFATNSEHVGRDFSQWNDVYKTLRGTYGARSTRLDPLDSRSSVYHVAAPITIDSKIAGVVTVYKSEGSILEFLDQALHKMFVGGLFSVIALGLFGGLIMVWITLPLEKLRMYALAVSEGRRGILPNTKIKEVKHLTEAFEKMRITLEGKKTVEKYTQTLTHELKSPLTAIKGAAELCLEEMNANQRHRFLKNIIVEADRSHLLLEQLLKIAALESKHDLDYKHRIDLLEVLNETREALIGLWKIKNITILIDEKSHVAFFGDRFLLFQAFRNILQNAIEFSEPNSEIKIQIQAGDNGTKIEFMDEGVGIPDFAKERIFEKFYSLERPDSKRKSSGLGLSFVKEVVELHHGQIEIESPSIGNRGTSVRIIIPKPNDARG